MKKLAPLFLLTCLYCILPAQDSCFLQKIYDPALEMHTDTGVNIMHHIAQRIDAYVNSFNGCHAPQFTATSINGTKINSADLQGKIVVLNFWFTRCKPCVGEFASLNKMVDEYAKYGVRFISFALDKKPVLDTFLVTHPLKYEVVADADSLAKIFRIMPYPTNIILNRDYIVEKIFHSGSVLPAEALKNYEKFKPYTDSLLRKQ